MSLLKLTPESERLRRIAKAHAAGELSQGEYRRIRAGVIESFGSGNVPELGDDTEPRWQPRLVDGGTAADMTAKRRPRGYWMVIIVSTLVIVVSLLSMTAWADTGPVIGPVAARDPNPTTSPRFDVARISVANEDELVALGLGREAMAAYLAERLAAIKAEAQVGAHGFTDDELVELGSLLSSLGAHDAATVFDGRDAEEILGLVKEQKTRRGVSVVQLERLAAEFTEYCRRQGLPLAVAFVPVQEVTGQTVALQVLPGRLDEVRIAGAADYPQQLLENAFAGQRGQTVQRDPVESAVYLINDLPGIETQATFVQGETVGGTDLELTVHTTRQWDVSFRLDNHGDDATDELRGIVEGGWLNPSGRGDAITGGILTSPDPDDSLYGYLNYDLPLGGVDTRLGVGLSRHDYHWRRSGLVVDGDATTADASVTRTLVRGRKTDINIDGGLAWQHLEQDAPGVTLKDQDLVIGTVGVGGRRVFDASRWVLDGRTAIAAVGVADGDVDGQDSATARLRFDGSAWRPLVLPGLGEQQRLRFRLSGQLATGSLPGTLQLGLGGVGAVRGYEPSIMSVDDGVVGSIEAHLAPWQAQRYGTAVLFGDAGYGEQRRTYGGDLWAYLSAVGLGWDWQYGNRFDTQLRWAFPLKTRGSADWLEDDGSRLWFVLRVRPWGS